MSSDFNRWLGRKERSVDFLSASMAKRLAVTLGDDAPAAGEALPPLWHWAFFQEPVVGSRLGVDGHPLTGDFLPAVEGRNRMWAGSRVSFLQPLRVEEYAQRYSTIRSIEEKQGKTGALLFVTVEHEYQQHGVTCVREEQDIVYRAPAPPKLTSVMPVPKMDWQDPVYPSPVMLFRYSAATFNSHRIHYDLPYATEQEGYPGLVVHGPMIATLLLRSFMQRFPHRAPQRFAFRGIRPLIADKEFLVGGIENLDQSCALLAFNDDGPAHQAEIQYKETK